MFTNAILYYGLHTLSVGTVKTYTKYYTKGENNKLLGVFPVNKLFHFLYIKKHTHYRVYSVITYK